MPRLRPSDLPRVAKDAAAGWSADNCSSMGAALAFYSLLSMAPLLMLVITIAGLAIGREAAQEVLMSQLAGLLGDTGAEGVKTMLSASESKREGLIATVGSLAVLLVGATTVFAELQDDLNRIWKCGGARAAGAWGFLRKRLLSFGLIVAIGLLLLMSLVVSAGISYVADAWFSGLGAAMAHVLELAASVAITAILFAITFKILPARRIAWGDVLLGSLVTAVLFAVGKLAIGLYLGKSAVASSFGAAGTVVVSIVWVYYSAQVFFFGAELTRAYSERHGSKSPQAANSDYDNEAAMVERARRIVMGRDPAIEKR